MKKLIWIIAGLLLLLITGAWLVRNQEKQTEKTVGLARPLPVTVSVAAARQQSLTTEIDYPGTTTFWREVPMTATTQGIVRSINYRLNGTVRAGQTLLAVDTDLNRASLTVAEAVLAKTTRDLARYETLQASNNATATEVEAARMQQHNARLQVVTLRKQLADAVVKAPTGGTITEKPIEAGMFIAPGTPLATITDVSTIKVLTFIPETDLRNWPTGITVPVRFDGYQGQTFNGTVHHIGLKADNANRFPVEIRVVNNRPASPLRVGMSAHIRRSETAAKQAVVVPRVALVLGADIVSVYVLTGQTVQLRPVTPGPQRGTDVAILSGLQLGEQVVVSGTANLKPNMRVQRSE